MKRFRAKFTYANVISTICLFLVLGGGAAFAATQLPKNSVGSKQIKKEAVTPAKLSSAAKATLTGPKGATGAAGPQGSKGDKGDKGERGLQGEAGTAVAYAHVAADGTLDTAHSKNVTATNLSGVVGDYCVTPSVPVTTVIVSTPHVGGDGGVVAQGNIVANGDASTGACTSPVWVSVWNRLGELEDHPFYVLFN